MDMLKETLDAADSAMQHLDDALPGSESLRVNMNPPERWVSAAIGGGLLYYGLRKRSLPGALIALAGAGLALRGATGTSLIYRLFGINTARRTGTEEDSKPMELRAETSIAIQRSPAEVYGFWKNLENLPRVMDHLKEVRVIDSTRSHWVAKAPAGIEIEWDAETTENRENQVIAWRSLEGADIRNEGSVHFDALGGGQATLLRVSLRYELPAGKAGKALGKLFGKYPDGILDRDLGRFKELMETGVAAESGD